MNFRKCKKIGTQTCLVTAIVITEILITLKFDWNTFTKPLPRHIALFWIIGLAGLALWTIWHFYLQRLLYHTEQKLKEDTPVHTVHSAEALSKSKPSDGSAVRSRGAPRPT